MQGDLLIITNVSEFVKFGTLQSNQLYCAMWILVGHIESVLIKTSGGSNMYYMAIVAMIAWLPWLLLLPTQYPHQSLSAIRDELKPYTTLTVDELARASVKDKVMGSTHNTQAYTQTHTHIHTHTFDCIVSAVQE